MDEQKSQENLYKLSLFQQQMQQLQQQLEAIERAINDMTSLSYEIDELENKENSKIFALIGRGIYAKGKLTSNKLLVDLGEGNLVNKSVSETKEIINKQIQKLKQAKQEINKSLEELDKEARKIIKESY